MNNSMRPLFLALSICMPAAPFLAALAAPLVGCAGDGQLEADVAALHTLGITGVIAELAQGDARFIERAGSARSGEAEPVPLDASFRLGSNTKTFVAVVALQLVGEGKLALDDTVERWLPDTVKGAGYDATQITVRHLLQHTSGIPDYTKDLLNMFTPEIYLERRLHHYEPEDLLALALQHSPDFTPGSTWEYSNTNYILVGMILQRVTGRTWATEVAERIVGPLGLSDTYDPGDEPELSAPHATGYDQFEEGGSLIDVTVQNQTIADAAGSLISSTHDLVEFWRAWRQGRLLAPAQMAEMQTTVPATSLQEIWPGVRYGLGVLQFRSSCGVYWSHPGDTFGYSTRNAVSDDGNRVVVVSLSTNLAGAAQGPVLAANQELLEHAMCGPQ